MGQQASQSRSTVRIEPLWVPSRGLDPDSYQDVFAHSKSEHLPARAAISDSRSGANAQAWCSLLAEGFVADHLVSVDDVQRSLPIRAAVFAAQSAMGMVPAAASVRAGLIGVTVLEDGTGVAVAAGGFSVVRVLSDGTTLRWNAAVNVGLSVFEDPAVPHSVRGMEHWAFAWRPGDTILVCGRGMPESMLTDAGAWYRDSLPSFQGRVRKAFMDDPAGPARSATVIRIHVDAERA